MPRSWEPDFDFYDARFDDTRVAIFLDLAARDHAPVATHPVRLHVRVAMQSPREDGLRADEEADALFAAEDAIVRYLETTHDAIYVGRVVTRGYTTWAFYVAEGASRPLAGAPSVAPYKLEWTGEPDPAWGYYREFLFPDEEAHKALLGRRAVDRITRAGTPDGLN
jgi:hypothetical protein